MKKVIGLLLGIAPGLFFAAITVAAPLQINESSPLVNGNVCNQMNQFLTASGGSGPTPYKWKVSAGTLPSGLTMPSSFATMSTVITGIPSTVQTKTFTVQVTDGARHTASKVFSLTIDPPLPLTITNQNSTLPAGTLGTAYSANLFTSPGGCLPLVWTITTGQLPPGLSLHQNSSGKDNNVISGTPTTRGTYVFTATVRGNDGQTASMQFSITIN
ncbi:MAG: putative Ig domain-containing protein [Nitrospirae bacterium]|nr:putative Ig domain-containing protein [Candidatus Manganitrophaceae bacterium]